MRQRIRAHALIYGVAVGWLFLVFLASGRDGTLTLPGNGKGLLDHRGYLALHLATPVALSISLLALEWFALLLARLDDFLVPGHGREVVLSLRDEHLASLNLRSRWVWLLLLFVITGALCSTAVLLQVIDPISTYGNDVFNATNYRWGYYVANSYLALAWTVIFPCSLFFVLHVTMSMAMLLSNARREHALLVDLLHSDNCGGLSPFGNVNLVLMLYYVPPFLAMVGLADTHARRYASLIIPALALSASFLVQSVFAVHAIHLAIREEKRARLAVLRAHLNDALVQPTTTRADALSFMLWDHVRGVRTMPYAEHVRGAVALLRYAPPAIALMKLFATRMT